MASNSGVELAIKLNKAGKSLGKANRDAVSQAALEYKNAVLDEARKDIGADLTLSHWGWRSNGSYRGLKLGAGYKVTGTSNAQARLEARPMGPWKVLEYGANKHEIKPRKRKKNGRLKLRDGKFSRGVMHRGSKGKRTWSTGIRKGTKPAMAVFSREHKSSLAKSFGIGP
jgi:hypothetical protein